MDYLAELYKEMDLDFSRVETDTQMDTDNATYLFVVQDWMGRGHAHYHTFDKNPAKNTLIAFAEQFIDDEGYFTGVEVSKMVETDEGEYWEICMELSNQKGKLKSE